MIKIHFLSSNTLGGLFLQAALFSDYNHVAIEVDGVLYDATLRYGVSKWTDIQPSLNASGYNTHEVITLNGVNEKACKDFLENQVGKQYDWKAIISLPLRVSWEDSEKWFCSELVAKALKEGGLDLFDQKVSRITPRDLLIVL